MSLFGDEFNTPIFKPEPEYSRIDVIEAEIRGSQAMLERIKVALSTYPPENCDMDIAKLIGKIYQLGYKDGRMSKARMP